MLNTENLRAMDQSNHALNSTFSVPIGDTLPFATCNARSCICAVKQNCVLEMHAELWTLQRVAEDILPIVDQ
jgi:hypothetical protein